MHSFAKDNYRFFLLREYQQRREKNPKYSWRAFARDLGVVPSRINEIMSSKVGISVERAQTFIDQLNLSKEEHDLFLDLIEVEHGRSKVARRFASERLIRRRPSKKVLTEEQFSLISQWYYIPLMKIFELALPNQEPAVLARLLDLTEAQIHEAIARLEQMGLICRQEDRYICLNPDFTTQQGSPSSSRRSYHKQLLQKAGEAIETQPLEERSFTSTVMTINKSQIGSVRERIRQFRADLVAEVDRNPEKNAVYCVAVNFFALTKSLE